MVDDHRSTLLEEARALKGRDRAHLAIVLYAIYFEHALNDLILVAATRSSLCSEISQRLVRSASIYDKTGSLPAELGLPSLPKRLVDGIRLMSSIRNEFIHYKWVGLSDEERDAYNAKVENALAQADELVVELKKFEADHLFRDYEKLLGQNSPK